MIPLPPKLALRLAAAIGAILLLALLVSERNRWKSTASLRQQQLVAEKGAHQATVVNYRAAAEQARREDAENLTRVKAQQTATNERTANDFENRIAAARAAAERLRRDARAGADPGSRGAAPVPAVSASTGGTAQATGGNGLSISERLIATEQAIQLDELIKWVQRQHAIKVNSGSAERQVVAPPEAP